MNGVERFAELLRENEDLQDQAAACETSQELAELMMEYDCKVSAEELEKIIAEDAEL